MSNFYTKIIQIIIIIGHLYGAVSWRAKVYRQPVQLRQAFRAGKARIEENEFG